MNTSEIRRKIADGSIYQSKRYKSWRKKIFVRDRYKCQMPNCGKVGGYLNAHHILPKYKNPELIYKKDNGITLCLCCHTWLHKTKQEKKYEKIFQELAKLNNPRPRLFKSKIRRIKTGGQKKIRPKNIKT